MLPNHESKESGPALTKFQHKLAHLSAVGLDAQTPQRRKALLRGLFDGVARRDVTVVFSAALVAVSTGALSLWDVVRAQLGSVMCRKSLRGRGAAVRMLRVMWEATVHADSVGMFRLLVGAEGETPLYFLAFVDKGRAATAVEDEWLPAGDSLLLCKPWVGQLVELCIAHLEAGTSAVSQMVVAHLLSCLSPAASLPPLDVSRLLTPKFKRRHLCETILSTRSTVGVRMLMNHLRVMSALAPVLAASAQDWWPERNMSLLRPLRGYGYFTASDARTRRDVRAFQESTATWRARYEARRRSLHKKNVRLHDLVIPLLELYGYLPSFGIEGVQGDMCPEGLAGAGDESVTVWDDTLSSQVMVKLVSSSMMYDTLTSKHTHGLLWLRLPPCMHAVFIAEMARLCHYGFHHLNWVDRISSDVSTPAECVLVALVAVAICHAISKITITSSCRHLHRYLPDLLRSTEHVKRVLAISSDALALPVHIASLRTGRITVVPVAVLAATLMSRRPACDVDALYFLVSQLEVQNALTEFVEVQTPVLQQCLDMCRSFRGLRRAWVEGCVHLYL
jgi:hypothetical protein